MRAVQIEFMKSQNAHQNVLVLVTGGNEKTGHSRADEAACQLVSRYGLPETSVRSIGGLASTLGNARDSLSYIFNHLDRNEFRQLDIITNDYHMLRAWLMFSFCAYEIATGKCVVIPRSTISQVRIHLSKNLSLISRDEHKDLREIRNYVMKILSPLLEQSLCKINPVVAEDTLENYGRRENKHCATRYARLLRSNRWVASTLPQEFNGISDFIAGSYGATKPDMSQRIQSGLT